jgi:RNA polymerase sigma-70 factor, ECF subfamily
MTEDHRAIETKLLELIPKLTSFALSLSRDRTLAEDIVHDVITGFLDRQRRGEVAPDNLEAWLIRATRNRYIDQYRQGQRKQTVDLDEAQSVKATVADPILRTSLERCLELRPEEERVLLISCGQGFSYAEIAETFEIPMGTVMSRLSRARKNLAECIDQ